MQQIGFIIYILFTISWFLSLPSRLPFLGLIRFDLLLVCVLFFTFYFSRIQEQSNDKTDKFLRLLILYAILTIPLVKWPGTVLKSGILIFIKAVVFYYFTVAFVNSEKRLKIFILCYIICQSIRVFEPIYLHVTQGYWGSLTYGEGEYLNRLSGGPHDTVNPNGLAFIIVSIIPFYHYLSNLSWKNKLLYAVSLPLMVYALILTSSRSGLICFMIILLGIFIKSNHKIIISILAVIGIFIAIINMSPQQKERYLSIVDADSKFSYSFQDRSNFNIEALKTTFKRPLFGYGLSTSFEVNSNFIGRGGPSHNLYIEVAQELGYIGLIIFLLYMVSVIRNFQSSLREFREKARDNKFLMGFTNAMQVWLFMSIIFSFASYGLLTPMWYLFGGLSVALKRVVSREFATGLT